MSTITKRKAGKLTKNFLRKMDAYWRAANYLSVGQKKLFTQFSFPGDIPSHVSPECPGSIHEGGELARLGQQLQDKLIEHKHYIDEHGQDLPEIRNWKWEVTRE